MQNLCRLELTDISFVLLEGELLKVRVFSVYTTKAISHKRAAIQKLCIEADGYKDTA